MLGRLAAISVGSILVILLLGTADAAASVPTCGGKAATIVGTPGPDVLEGTDGPDVIVGLGGADEISVLGSGDYACGGPGADRLLAGGEVHLWGGRGPDRLVGLFAVARGGAGNDYLGGGFGRPASPISTLLLGGRGKDVLFGAVVPLRGGPGDDRLRGLQSPIRGGPGDDVLLAFRSSTVSYEGAARGITAHLGRGIVRGEGRDEIKGRPRFVGSPFADRIYSNEPADSIRALGGDDTVRTGAGDDTILGGAGRDLIRAEHGVDSVRGGPGHDELSGGRGSDTLSGDGGDDSLDGGFGVDQVDGGLGTDTCSGETEIGCERDVEKDVVLDADEVDGLLDLASLRFEKVTGDGPLLIVVKTHAAWTKRVLRGFSVNKLIVSLDVDRDGLSDYRARIRRVGDDNLKVFIRGSGSVFEPVPATKTNGRTVRFEIPGSSAFRGSRGDGPGASPNPDGAAPDMRADSWFIEAGECDPASGSPPCVDRAPDTGWL
jgi:Ca2+-binding RTX toxin-like protein